MRISVVAAVARNGVIGRAGAIPWRIPEDAARFKELTTGHGVVMGRKTWDSLPERFRPLPGRRNVVVTRRPGWRAEGAERAGSLEDALALLRGDERVFVIGGAELYEAALPVVDELLLTEIDADVDGDVVFPAWDRQAFDEVARESRVGDDGVAFAFVAYRRKDSGDDGAGRQLAALSAVDALLAGAGIEYWLFGGWAVDFYAGSITRAHDDVDVAVWLDDLARISDLLEGDGWHHAPEPEEDGGTGFERDGVGLELTYLVRRADGRVATPLRGGRSASWPDGAFGDEVGGLRGTRARLVGRAALTRGKSVPRDDPVDAAKDLADHRTLSQLDP